MTVSWSLEQWQPKDQAKKSEIIWRSQDRCSLSRKSTLSNYISDGKFHSASLDITFVSSRHVKGIFPTTTQRTPYLSGLISGTWHYNHRNLLHFLEINPYWRAFLASRWSTQIEILKPSALNFRNCTESLGSTRAYGVFNPRANSHHCLQKTLAWQLDSGLRPTWSKLENPNGSWLQQCAKCIYSKW